MQKIIVGEDKYGNKKIHDTRDQGQGGASNTNLYMGDT